MRPLATTTVSPGSTRRMPAKIVSRPVVNCSCSSSLRAWRTSSAATRPPANQALRLGGEGEALGGLGVIERLDAERIARQHQPPRRRIVQRDRIHAAQMAREIEPVPAIEMQRQLAIRRGRENGVGQRRAQLEVIVDLAIGDERRAARLVERLIAGREIDDREPRLHHADIARAVMPVAVGPAMEQRRLHRLQARLGGGSPLALIMPAMPHISAAPRSKSSR